MPSPTKHRQNTDKIGEQKIDLIVREITQVCEPIHNIAKATGIKLLSKTC